MLWTFTDQSTVASMQNAVEDLPLQQADNPHAEHGLTDNIQVQNKFRV